MPLNRDFCKTGFVCQRPKLVDSLGERATSWTATPSASVRTAVPVAARPVARSGTGTLHQCVQLPELGTLGEGGAALLSGVAVIVKTAAATAWLTQRNVQDVNVAGILPLGAYR